MLSTEIKFNPFKTHRLTPSTRPKVIFIKIPLDYYTFILTDYNSSFSVIAKIYRLRITYSI